MKLLHSLYVLPALLALPAAAQQAQSVLMLTVAPVCVVSDVRHQLPESSGGVVTGVTTFRYYLRTGRNGGAELTVRFPGEPQQSFALQLSLAGPGTPVAIQSLPAGNSALAATFGPRQHTSRVGASAAIRWSSSTPPAAAVPQPELAFSCR